MSMWKRNLFSHFFVTLIEYVNFVYEFFSLYSNLQALSLFNIQTQKLFVSTCTFNRSKLPFFYQRADEQFEVIAVCLIFLRPFAFHLKVTDSITIFVPTQFRAQTLYFDTHRYTKKKRISISLCDGSTEEKKPSNNTLAQKAKFNDSPENQKFKQISFCRWWPVYTMTRDAAAAKKLTSITVFTLISLGANTRNHFVELEKWFHPSKLVGEVFLRLEKFYSHFNFSHNWNKFLTTLSE